MENRTESEFQSSRGERPHTIHTYRWLPPVGTAPKGVVFLVHGFRSHTGFNYLRFDASSTPTKYGMYEGSFVEQLVAAGLAVFSHDHFGHGKSSGTRGYFDSIKQLEDDTLDFVDDSLASNGFIDLPKFIVGHSLGGSIVCLCVRSRPDFFTGVIFSSAAVEPPADMLGIKGRIMAPFSSLFSWVAPELQVISLPKNDNEPELHQIFVDDPLCLDAVGVRARVGHEMLCMYHTLSIGREKIIVPFLYAAGGLDSLVNPEAGERFFKDVSSTDKEYISFPQSWHNLFVEKDNEEVRQKSCLLDQLSGDKNASFNLSAQDKPIIKEA